MRLATVGDKFADRSMSAARTSRPTQEEARIVLYVTRAYRMTPEDLRKADKRRNVVCARFVAMYLLAQSGASTPRIGRLLGGLHHTSVLYGVNRVREELSNGTAGLAELLEGAAVQPKPQTFEVPQIKRATA